MVVLLGQVGGQLIKLFIGNSGVTRSQEVSHYRSQN
jgi:hypothetical protein